MRLRGWYKQYAFAVAIGVSESTITRWREDGAMSLESAISVCRELDISLDWFVTGNGTMEQHKLKPLEYSSTDERLRSAIKTLRDRLSAEVHNSLIDLISALK